MATSEEVARLAGVSRATVSRVLNGSANVSEETRKRIQDAVTTLGYEPDVVAQSLARQRSRTIALSIFSERHGSPLAQFGQTQHYFYLDLLHNVELELSAHHYDLLLASASHADERDDYVRSLRSRRVAGAITIAVGPRDPRVAALLDADFPTVCIDGYVVGPRVTYVASDNTDGTRQATNYLLQLGHRRIVAMLGSAAFQPGKERLSGYQQTLSQVGLELDHALVYRSGWNTEDAYQTAMTLLSEQRDFTAILAGNDLMALGILRALHERGVRVPEDVSVIGFDDVDLCRYTEPPLTTVRQHRAEMAKAAVELLLRLMEEDTTQVPPVIVPTQLVVRSSTGPAKQRSYS